MLLNPRRQRTDLRPTGRKVRVNGHRGQSHTLPENTLPSLREAVWLGADGLEFDVRLTRDGLPIVMHDATFRRTTNVREVFADRAGDSVSTFTAAEVAQLDAGAWKDAACDGTPVPMLRDIMHAFEEIPIRMSVELKATEVPATEVAEAVTAAVGERPDVTIMSFKRPLLEAVLAIRPTARVGLIACGRPSATDIATYDEFHLDSKIVRPKVVDRIHESGKSVTAWTVDSPLVARAMVRSGVDAITTNRVDLIGRVVARQAPAQTGRR